MKWFLSLVLVFALGCSTDPYEIYKWDGINAFACVMESKVKPEVECPCNGTKIVKPDGKIEMPCPCKDCKCGQQKRTKQILYFSTKNCGPCAKVEKKSFPALEKAGWKFGPEGHIMKASNLAPDTVSPEEKYKVEVFPTFILLKDGKEVGRREGYLSAQEIADFYGSIK